PRIQQNQDISDTIGHNSSKILLGPTKPIAGLPTREDLLKHNKGKTPTCLICPSSIVSIDVAWLLPHKQQSPVTKSGK
ncbi:MAG: hypothetical protein ACK53Y_08320, partial [bacterium]